ncbi:hypothetical protein JCM3765_002997 [Sporobolomyces pararoseus]
MGFATEFPYKPEPVTDRDLKVATLAFGFVIGFIIPCCNTAWSQTHKLSAYTVMIWGEIIVCWVFAVICWLYLIDVIPHSFAFFFSILTCWALQGDLIVKISSAKPARAQFDPNFEGLKIAVSTHTTTTAVRFEDVGDADDNEKMVDGLRKTRTPARPDLSIRLEKIRQNRKARKAAAEQDGLPQRRGSDAHSDDDDDVKIDMEMEETANWENSIHHLPAHGTYSPASGSGSFVDEKL